MHEGTTAVPVAVFDELLDAIEAPPQRNAELAEAAAQAAQRLMRD